MIKRKYPFCCCLLTLGFLLFVFNGMEQCNFLGQRERSFFIVLRQRDNGTSSKSCHGTERAGTACQNLGLDAGGDNYYFYCQNLGRDEGWDGTITIYSYDFLF